jgi:Winged helix-turn helix
MPGWLRSEQVAGLRRNRWLASSESAYKARHIVDLVKDTWGIRISPETARTRLHAMNLVPLVCRPRHHEADPVAQAAFKETFPQVLAKIASEHPEAAQIEVWVQDESRVGQKGKVGRRWTEKGSHTRRRVCMAGSNQPGCSAPSVPNATSAPLSSLSR